MEEGDNYAEKTPDYVEISKINLVAPLAFSNVKIIYVYVLPTILALFDMFDLLLLFVDTYFFVQRCFSSFRCCVCLKLSNQALNRTRKCGNQ